MLASDFYVLVLIYLSIICIVLSTVCSLYAVLGNLCKFLYKLILIKNMP